MTSEGSGKRPEGGGVGGCGPGQLLQSPLGAPLDGARGRAAKWHAATTALLLQMKMHGRPAPAIARPPAALRCRGWFWCEWRRSGIQIRSPSSGAAGRTPAATAACCHGNGPSARARFASSARAGRACAWGSGDCNKSARAARRAQQSSRRSKLLVHSRRLPARAKRKSNNSELQRSYPMATGQLSPVRQSGLGEIDAFTGMSLQA